MNPLRISSIIVSCVLVLVGGRLAAADATPTSSVTSSIPGTSPLIAITDSVSVVRDEASGVASVDRLFNSPRGYRWNAPGARIRFRTDSPSVSVRLNYSARHLGPSRNSVGFYRIDGEARDAWRFTRPAGAPFPGDAPLAFALPVPATDDDAASGASGDRAFHEYELILPYGDAVELAGIDVAPDARWQPAAPRPATRWVAFGDSVTHGFTASDVRHSYPFLVGEAKGWEVINAAIAGRGTRATDADILAKLEADIFTVALGVNDWQGGVALERFHNEMTGLLRRLRAARPEASIYVITPLWVPPSWAPAKAAYSLENYREIICEVVATFADDNLRVIDGPSLIDPDPALFDRVAVHPNDAGFAQMAARLTALLAP